ncbi:uncharacterized protein LOC106874886 [Octopus bimaculoides]|uniref:Uncharacterized protein n=1 Tax=Octopus bimaculoides TaxID=37653 RepID=A0A0L8GU77_OCTBM|nr:uncharacterized protein LOC106874886 [Octopus bimaculoides]|eukprot:XP_014778281.1 PREDICTED: uncharacterized protein LOC106874886 [Octopus bimaculoides]
MTCNSKMSPKSDRERMKKYRQRMDEEKQLEVRKKNAEQQKKSRAKWSSGRKEKEAEKSKLRMRASRKRAKQIQGVLSDMPNNSDTEEAFRNKRSLSRAVHHVQKLLPKSPKKKTAVVKVIRTKSCGLHACQWTQYYF